MTAKIIFQSSRLYARTFIPQQDASAAFLLYGDEEVTKFLGSNKTDTCIAETEQRLVRYTACEDGRGIMALLRKQDDLLVGTILLKRLPNQNFEPTTDWEVGWHLRRSAWGAGYASEAGGAALEYGLKTLNLPQIFAVVDTSNVASRKVVERLNMVHLGQTDRYYGETLELFSTVSSSA